jgi:hypothetical protein
VLASEQDLHWLVSVGLDALDEHNRALGRAWLARIAAANRTRRSYDPRTLDRVLARVWMRVCYASFVSSRSGMTAAPGLPDLRLLGPRLGTIISLAWLRQRVSGSRATAAPGY